MAENCLPAQVSAKKPQKAKVNDRHKKKRVRHCNQAGYCGTKQKKNHAASARWREQKQKYGIAQGGRRGKLDICKHHINIEHYQNKSKCQQAAEGEQNGRNSAGVKQIKDSRNKQYGRHSMRRNTCQRPSMPILAKSRKEDTARVVRSTAQQADNEFSHSD